LLLACTRFCVPVRDGRRGGTGRGPGHGTRDDDARAVQLSAYTPCVAVAALVCTGAGVDRFYFLYANPPQEWTGSPYWEEPKSR
jgi:hypothetical protein